MCRTDNCTFIASANDITITELTEWNPALESDCSGLEPNYYICVDMPGATDAGSNQTTASGTSGSAPTTTSATLSSSLATPNPVQVSSLTEIYVDGVCYWQKTYNSG